MKLVPTRAFLTAGSAQHDHELVAFELALRAAGIAAQNLVTVSSILPPGCVLVGREEGRRHLEPGQILHVVMSRVATRDVGTASVASIGVARPRDGRAHGFIAEHVGTASPEVEEVAAVELARTMLASSLPPETSPSVWAEAEVNSTASISAVARCESPGRWSVGVACCALLQDPA